MGSDKYIYIKGSATKPSSISIPNMPSFSSGSKEMPIIVRGTDAVFKIPPREPGCVRLVFIVTRGDWSKEPVYQAFVENRLQEEITFTISAAETARMPVDTFFYSLVELRISNSPGSGFPETAIVAEGTFSIKDSAIAYPGTFASPRLPENPPASPNGLKVSISGETPVGVGSDTALITFPFSFGGVPFVKVTLVGPHPLAISLTSLTVSDCTVKLSGAPIEAGTKVIWTATYDEGGVPAPTPTIPPSNIEILETGEVAIPPGDDIVVVTFAVAAEEVPIIDLTVISPHPLATSITSVTLTGFVVKLSGAPLSAGSIISWRSIKKPIQPL